MTVRAGIPGPRSAAGPRLDDSKVEQMRQTHLRKLDELGRLPSATVKFIADVSLLDGVETPIAHGLGRPARFVKESSPRGGLAVGAIEEVRTGTFDTSKYVVLKASGWGATVVVDVQVA